MSDKPKDDHGGGDKKKKSLPATLVGISIAVLLFLLFFIFNSITVPETLNASANLIAGTGRGIGRNGDALTVAAEGVRNFGRGTKDFMIALLLLVLIGGILFMIIKYGFKLFFGKKKDDGHGGDHGHGEKKDDGHGKAAH